jgi:hypothetical protein
MTLSARAKENSGESVVAHIRIDPGHPWRPPFGLERVGQPLVVVVEIESAPKSVQKYSLTSYRNGQEIGHREVPVTGRFPSTNRVTLATWPTELVLSASDPDGKAVALARNAIQPVGFEADAIAQPDTLINPIDLGTVLIPNDWLLLGSGQRASVGIAAICRTNHMIGSRARAWFESNPKKSSSSDIELAENQKTQINLILPTEPAKLDRDILHVTILDSAKKELWHKKIPTMLVHNKPKWPAFGATETKLRYDAPISLLSRETSQLSSMSYSNGWAPHLKDVVVSLPNGSRFVFWRGSSYVPFWAGRHNTGLSYEWAETGPLPEGFVDSVEPLMDKELRYGRVQIVESTAARVHVRWSYQSCDFNYKVWGDSAEEDFYFYPDGFGTRVLRLQSSLDADYELSEFIILTSQATYPFEVLPQKLVDVIFMDGQKRELSFPFLEPEQAESRKSRDMSAIYRVRLHKDETAAAIYFNPSDKKLPPAIFQPFYDRGYMVTPCYWGSHWPLARGKSTGGSIDDRIYFSPAHNSVMSWARSRPSPLSTRVLETIDTLGKSKPMMIQQWAWLIGTTDADDARLLEWAHSFEKPPSLEVQGARLGADSHSPERRAISLTIESETVTIILNPSVRCVNPVFELLRSPKILLGVKIGTRQMNSKDYAWDGRTLWLNASFDARTELQLKFSNSPRGSALDRGAASPGVPRSSPPTSAGGQTSLTPQQPTRRADWVAGE